MEQAGKVWKVKARTAGRRTNERGCAILPDSMIPPCSTIRVCRTCGEAINEARPAMTGNPNMCRLCTVLSWTLALPEEKKEQKLVDWTPQEVREIITNRWNGKKP